MKRIFKIFVFILVLILGFSVNVLACDFSEKQIGIGKNYKKFFSSKNINPEVLSEEYSEINIRGNDICNELKGAEVTIIITDSKVAGIKIDSYNSLEKIIYPTAVNSFGEPSIEPNFDKIIGVYASHFDKGNTYSTYKYSKTGNKINETIFIMEKELMSEIDKNNKTKEKSDK